MTEIRRYAALGDYSDLVKVLQGDRALFGSDRPGPEEVRRRLLARFAPPRLPVRTPEVEVTGSWTRDGLDGRELRWHVGYGPATEARMLRPAGAGGPLPGVVMMHCHGGRKTWGKDKLADGAEGRPASSTISDVRDELYAGRAPAEWLARRGFTVLVHDVFGWGSRRLALDTLPPRVKRAAEAELALRRHRGEPCDQETVYEVHAGPAEDAMAKTLGVLGTSWAGVLAAEDAAAVRVLASTADVGPVGVLGLSGGGSRAAVVAALTDQVRTAVVVCMTSTLEALLDGYLGSHTWAMLSPGLGRVGDWSDVLAACAPRPLLVQYGLRDTLFPPDGMRCADRRIRAAYTHSDARDAYRGSFFDAPHTFDAAMQQEAAGWLAECLLRR